MSSSILDDLGDPNEPTVMKVGVAYRVIRTMCEGPGCTVTIEQPYRAGRHRRFHSDACRQRAHRAKQKKPTPDMAAWVRALRES